MKNEVRFLGTNDPENYRCLFYKNRVCHVREQIKISDEKLQEDMLKTETWRENAGRVVEEPTRNNIAKYFSNTAHWLVTEFCGICPHRDH